jgi:hypothetical protein
VTVLVAIVKADPGLGGSEFDSGVRLALDHVTMSALMVVLQTLIFIAISLKESKVIDTRKETNFGTYVYENFI